MKSKIEIPLDVILKYDEEFGNKKSGEQEEIVKLFKKEQPHILEYLAVISETLEEKLWNTLTYCATVIWQSYRETAGGKLGKVGKKAVYQLLDDELSLIEGIEDIVDNISEENILRDAEKLVKDYDKINEKMNNGIPLTKEEEKVRNVHEMVYRNYDVSTNQDGILEYFDDYVEPEMLDEEFSQDDTDYIIIQLTKIANLFDNVLNK